MFNCRAVLGMLVVGLVLSGGLSGQDQPKTRAKGQLPQQWSKLGLSSDQKQKIYSIRSEYRGKIDELNQKIAALRKQERADMEKVLTDSQKTRLRELLLERAPADTAKPVKK